MNVAPRFHFFHCWSKWEVITSYVLTRQARECLYCGKRQERFIY